MSRRGGNQRWLRRLFGAAMRRRAWAITLGCFPLMLSCSDLPESGSFGGATAGAGAAAGGRASGGGGAGGAPAIAMHSGVLSDEGLVVRYYLDEASQGTEPTEVIDAAPNPLPLPLSYAAEMSYTEDGKGHRGLAFSVAGGAAMASLPVTGTKVFDALNGAPAASIELVVRVAALFPNSSRFLHLGAPSLRSLAMEARELSFVAFSLERDSDHKGPVDWAGVGRVVLHGVFDGSHSVEHDRMRIYLDGSRLPALQAQSVAQGHLLTVLDSDALVLGNKPPGGRSFVGTLHYAAIYRAALSDELVRQHAFVLLDNDDTPSK